MLKLEFSTDAIEALRYWRFHHPHPQVQRKMEVVYWRSQGLGDEQIQRLCAISKAPFYRYLVYLPRNSYTLLVVAQTNTLR